MGDNKVQGIYRENRFSPGKVSEDAAVLDATLSHLSHAGFRVNALQTDDLNDMTPKPDIVLSMAQSVGALDILERWEKGGVKVINTVQSVRNCYRKTLICLLQDADIPMPPSRMVKTGGLKRHFTDRPYGSWLKRGDVHAMEPADVVRIHSEADLDQAIRHFRTKQIEDVLVQDHVDGKVIKFYGVGKDRFFHAREFDSGCVVSPVPEDLVDVAGNAARAADLEVYGGDAVRTPSGATVLIDLNDWPSFSSCCAEAAQGIATYVKKKY